MRLFIRGMGILGGLLLLAGCGKTSCTGVLFKEICFGYVNQGTVVVTAATISGTGSVVAQVPLSGASTPNSYRVTFTLNDGGKLTLDANASATLTSGIQVEFKRTGTTLSVKLKGSGTTKDLSSSFSGIDASTQLVYQLDVHNQENPVDFLVWDSTVTSFTVGTARVRDNTGPAQATGGAFWGFELENASLVAIALSGPKFAD